MDNVEFQFSFVIGSDIGEELCNFKNNKSCNTRIVEKILHYYKNYPIFTTSALMQKYYYDFPTILKSVLSNTTTPRIDIDNSSEKDIAKHTIYKVVLCNDENKKDIFPYIYIGGDKVENNFTATFSKIDPRDKVKEHLKALICNAKEISIYDRYMLDNGNKESFQQFCNEILSINKLGIKIIYIHSNNDKCKEMGEYLKEKHPNLEWIAQHPTQEQQKNYAHDRYLIIDNKIEVIFTSGIHHLMNDNKDFTCIVRQHK